MVYDYVYYTKNLFRPAIFSAGTASSECKIMGACDQERDILNNDAHVLKGHGASFLSCS